MVKALCRHVSDDSPTVRRLCLRGLVKVFLIIEFPSPHPGMRLNLFSWTSLYGFGISKTLSNTTLFGHSMECINEKIRANAYAAFGALSNYGIGPQRDSFLEQLSLIGDYEDFLRELARQLTQNFAARVDRYMTSIIQAFDAPWPVVQANAVYLCSSVLSLSDDKHISSHYYNQVFPEHLLFV
ncbi:hypothetical protein KY290_036163 [Solanum tuberosum]|uniref:Uncharacterized protein n=1 Tax=Solanum tuberosum TaxID=4113 RepID=A0ABQ7TSQ6_SOLTU|nr:hypothetical protein KY290_036163 [Solanum tuberosum]